MIRRGGGWTWRAPYQPQQRRRVAPNTAEPVLIEPGTLALTLTFFAPTVVTPVTVTPGTLALTLTFFAPTVSVGGAVTVVPGVLSLVLTFFAPLVQTPRLVTPGTLSLVLTFFAPLVSTPRVVVPGVLPLVLTFFAPTVLTPRVVVPGTLSLVLSFFAPLVQTGVRVTPPTLSLVLTFFAPTVFLPRVVVPGTLPLVLTFFAPTVTTSGAPAPLALKLFRRWPWEHLAASVNLVTNPSFETNLTGWAGRTGATIQRFQHERSLVGRFLMRVTAPGSAAGEGATFSRITVSPSTAYTFTAYVKAAGDFKLVIDEYTGGDVFVRSEVGPSAVGSSHSFGRYRVTVVTSGSTGKLDLAVVTSSAQAVIFDVDAVQLEQSAEPTPYFDGARGAGLAWTGTAHASTSTRPAMRLAGDGPGQHWVLEQIDPIP